MSNFFASSIWLKDSKWSNEKEFLEKRNLNLDQKCCTWIFFVMLCNLNCTCCVLLYIFLKWDYISKSTTRGIEKIANPLLDSGHFCMLLSKNYMVFFPSKFCKTWCNYMNIYCFLQFWSEIYFFVQNWM